VQKQVNAMYGNKIRVRCCGILIYQNKALLVNHKGLNKDNVYWNFPGGGNNLHETLSQTVIREFEEEVNIKITKPELCYINELILEPLHALEFYFKVESQKPIAKLGFDPELNIITEFKWFDWNELLNLPTHQRPRFLKQFNSFNDLIINKASHNLINGYA
jgi:8-oxo-dGTP diphosphatase